MKLLGWGIITLFCPEAIQGVNQRDCDSKKDADHNDGRGQVKLVDIA